MARLLLSNTPSSLTVSPPALPSRASRSPPHVPFSPAPRFSFWQSRGLAVVTRAGPTANQYVFAFVLPLSLVAVTVFTSIRVADKLDRDFLEEMAINQAITDEDDEDDLPSEEQPAVSRTRNRPKREV